MPQLNFYQELTDNFVSLSCLGENDFIASLANTSALIYEKLRQDKLGPDFILMMVTH